MPSISSLSLLCIYSLSLFGDIASARHIHGHRRHRHHGRQETTLPSSLEVSPPSIPTPAPSDIANISDDLTDLPMTLLKFAKALEQRLQDIESILASLLSGLGTTSISGTQVATQTTTTDLPPTITTSPTEVASATSTSSSSLCRPAGAGPLVPCSTSEVSSTLSTQAVVPEQPPNPTSSHIIQSNSAVAATISVEYSSETAPSSILSSPVASQPGPSPYTFRPDSEDNVAVYYGTTPTTQSGGLQSLCENPNIDIAILSFVYDFFSAEGYPTLNFGPGCSASNSAQAQQAPGLLDCTALAAEIASCQQIGKKVLVSLGGYVANTTLASDDQATALAETLWNLFGAGTGGDPDLRPFGRDVVVDGFDIDNENHQTAYYETFATALREQFDTDMSKTYYLSAAPQCPIPDESIPIGAMAQADFVWVQFYNNPQCNLDSDGFQASFEAWSSNLSSASSTPGTPRLYIGAGAFEGAGSGYVEGSGLSTVVSLARELNVDNFGGIMLWDGSEGSVNVDQYDVNYLEYSKAALH